MEVWIFYVPALARVLVPILLILSTLKFVLVAMFYMHLKFDHAWFSYVFIGPLIIAIGLAVSLLWLFGHLGTTGGRMTWHWHPEVALGLEALLVAYFVLIGPLRRRRGWGPRPSGARVAAFLGGTALLAGALLGPLAEWAEYVALSAHMVQHLLLILVVPVLWLLGLPAWLLAPVPRVPILGRLGFGLTRPLPALALASAVQVAWHLPPAFDAALRVEWLHALEHVSFLATGLLLWWPVAGPAAEWPRPAPPAQLLYLFLATIPMMAIAAPITLAEDVLYRAYAVGGRALAPRPAGGPGAGRGPHVGGRNVRLPRRRHRGLLPLGRPRGARRRRGAPAPAHRATWSTGTNARAHGA